MARISIHTILLLVVVLGLLPGQCEGWRRRRRRRRCAVTYSNWGNWGPCSSKRCYINGKQYRKQIANCGAAAKSEDRDCAAVCHCKVSVYYYTTACSVTCGTGTRTQTRFITTKPSINGNPCPTTNVKTVACTPASCPIDCVMNAWGAWKCNAPCNGRGIQYRHRYVATQPQYGGKSCPASRDASSCSGPCCKVDCKPSKWSPYTACTATCGYGTKTRTRKILTQPSCGGAACPALLEVSKCSRFLHRNCQVNSWGQWSGCIFKYGVCGSGTKHRRRSVRVIPVCGGASCPSLDGTAACIKCCPANCLRNSWSSWSTTCPATCGSSLLYRYRHVRIPASCRGTCSGSNVDQRSCIRRIPVNCVPGSWSKWTACSNQCGIGVHTRTRGVVTAASCGGKCSSTTQHQPCKVYQSRDCTAAAWSRWSVCLQNACVQGSRSRTRVITPPVCLGKCYLSPTETQVCGPVNGGCQQLCNNGRCYCNPGYTIQPGGKCSLRSCGKPTSASYCPPGKTCSTPLYTCKAGYLYLRTCFLSCPSKYRLVGPSSITCQSSGVWTAHASYCELTNQPPTKMTLSSTSLAENTPAGTKVGSLTTIDPNTGDTHTYSFADSTSGSKFGLKGSTLVTKFVPDFESLPNKYIVKIKSTDQGGLSVTATFTITITDLIDPATSCSFSGKGKVPENSAQDTQVDVLQTAYQGQGQKFIYKLLNSAGGRFKVSGNQVQVAPSNVKCLAVGGPACQLNFEATNRYTITVRSTNAANPSQNIDCNLNIDLTDVNDSPRSLTLSGLHTVQEGMPVGTIVGQLSCSDEDRGQTIKYTLTDDDKGGYRVSQNKYIVTGRVFDHEVSSLRGITVKATDNGLPAMSIYSSFDITITNKEEAPVSITLTPTARQSFPPYNALINENSLPNTVVGTFFAVDGDANAKLKFSLVSNAGGKFKVTTTGSCGPVSKGTGTQCTATLLVAGPLDYEQDKLHNIVVRVVDEAGLAKTQPFTIMVRNVNDRPESISTADSPPQVKENRNNAVITTFTTKDDDVTAKFTYTLISNPSGKFKIVGSRLMTTATANLDYETRSSYVIIVRSSDGGSPVQYVDAKFTIKVINVNEPPSLVTLNKNDVFENPPAGTTIGSFTAIDPDNVSGAKQQQITYTVLNTAGGIFKVVGNTLQVAASNVDCLKYGGASCKLNYEVAKSHVITVQATDNGNPPLSSKIFTFVIKVLNINDAPRSLSLSNTVVKESVPVGSVIGLFTFTDEDKVGVHKVTLSNSANGQFSIAPKTGGGYQVILQKQLDYNKKTSYSITILVTNPGSPTFAIPMGFVIRVQKVPGGAAAIDFTDYQGQLSFLTNQAEVNENSPKNSVVGTLTSVSQRANQQLVFKLISGHGLFSIGPTQCAAGAVQVCNTSVHVAGSLNHESTSKHSIIVQAIVAAGTGNLLVRTFPITVNDVNEAPTGIDLSGGKPQVAENKANALIGSLSTPDPDPGQTFTYSIISGGKGLQITGNQLRTLGALNYESASSIAVTIRSTDSGSPQLSIVKDFVVTVLDVNEAPSALSITPSTGVRENCKQYTVVGSFSAGDPDNTPIIRQSFTYSLVTSGDGRFLLDKNILKVAESNANCIKYGGGYCRLNYESQKSYTIAVKVTDNGVPSLSKTLSVVIKLIDENDPPRNLALSNSLIRENDPAGTIVAKITYNDEDKLQTHSVVLLDDDSGQFKLSKDGTQLLKAKSTDYETKAAHRVVIQVSDNGKPSKQMTKTFVITVLNVNEAPQSLTLKSSSGPDDYPRVDENVPINTVVGLIQAFDQDLNEKLKFSLDSSGGGLFALASSPTCVYTRGSACSVQLIVAGKLNYEIQKSIPITVRVTDTNKKSIARTFLIAVNDINDPPTNLMLSSLTVPEGPANSVVGAFSTVDPDLGQTFLYTLVKGTSHFKIVGDKLLTTVALNYEDPVNIFTIQVKSNDNGKPSLSVTATFTITVLNVNERPTSVNLVPNIVNENSARGTVVGYLTAVDPDSKDVPRQKFTYSLLDDAGNRFEIDGNAVKVAASNVACLKYGGLSCELDYERQSSYKITVEVIDNGSPPARNTFVVTIRLRDVNDKPYNLSITNTIVVENAPANTEVGLINFNDQDITDTHTVTLINDDNGQFKLNVSNQRQLLKAKPTDYESKRVHTITIRVTDNRNQILFVERNFNISVVNINEPPVSMEFIDQDGQLSFPTNYSRILENAAYNTVCGTIRARDKDANEHLSITLDDDSNGLFAVSSTTCTWNVASTCLSQVIVVGSLDHETESNHYITVRVTDSKGLFRVHRFQISIVDVNERPTNITLPTSRPSVVENQANALIGTLTTNDVDQLGKFRYSLQVNPSGKFKIVGSQLRTAVALNYEEQSTYIIKVRSYDNGSPALYVDQVFTIRVIDVNERPSALNTTTMYINENSPLNAFIGVIVGIDPDNFRHRGRQTLTYDLIDSANGLFKLDQDILRVNAGNVDCLKFGGSFCQLNYEAKKSYDIVVRVTDNGIGNLSNQFKVTVHLKDINDQPRSLRISNNIVNENVAVGTAIGMFTSTDEDVGQGAVYRLINNAGGRFKIDKDMVTLVTAAMLNFEQTNVFTITVEVKDTGKPKMSMQQTFVISVLNVNEAPLSVTLKSSSGSKAFPDNRPNVDESAPIYTVVGLLQAFDPDSHDNLTISLDSNGNGLFALASTSTCVQTRGSMCSVQLIVKGKLDYEIQKSISITVRVTDTSGKSIARTFVVAVNDINDPPTKLEISSLTVPEGPSNSVVGAFSTVDPDPSQTKFVYTLLKGSSHFKIVGDKLLTATALNYEAPVNTFIIQVQSNDTGKPSLSVTATFTITVLNVNERPTSVNLAPNIVNENSARGTVVGYLTAVDPDSKDVPRQKFTYSLLANAGNRFEIDGNVVKVSVSNVACLKYGGLACELDYERQSTYNITVEVIDNGSPPERNNFVVSIRLRDVNDKPYNLSITNTIVVENAPADTEVGLINFNDHDITGTHTVTLINDDNGQFKLNVSNRRQLLKAKPTDYESKHVHTITIRVTDNRNQSLFVERNFNISVVNINEPPVSVAFTDQDGQLTFPTNFSRILENAAYNTVCGTIRALDKDANERLSITLDDDSNGLFAVSSTTCTWNVASTCLAQVIVVGSLDHETESNHYITVRVTDSKGLFRVHRFQISIVDVNERPTNITLPTSRPSVVENQANALIGTFTTYDVDQLGKFRYSLEVNPSGKFKIVGSELRTAVALNYEEQSTYIIKVRSYDNGSPALYVDQVFTIRVIDVNERPSALNTTTMYINENSPLNAFIGVMVGIDPDNFRHSGRQTLTYSLIDSANGLFKLDKDILRVKTSNVDCLKFGGSFCQLNYEAKKSYDIVVRVTDNGIGNLSNQFKVTVYLKDINDQPRSLTISNNIVNENVAIGTPIGMFTSTDEDVGQGAVYRLINNAGGRFKIDKDMVTMVTAAMLNFEQTNVFTITVEVTDTGTPKKSMNRTFIVSVNDLNEAPLQPTFTSQGGAVTFPIDQAEVPEDAKNGSVIGTINCVDLEPNQQLNITLDDNAGGLFAVSAARCSQLSGTTCSASITVANNLDHETLYMHYITVRVTDQDGAFSAKRFSIKVADVNDPPVSLSSIPSRLAVAENSAGTLFGSFSTEDLDRPKQTFTYTLVNGDGTFKIIGNEVFTVKALDYETQASYTIRVKSTDSGSPALSIESTFVVTVTDVNEPATDLQLIKNSVPENSPENREVGKLFATDPENSVSVTQTFTFIIKDNADNRFKLVNGNEIQVAQSNANCLLYGGVYCRLNFESQPSYNITVAVTDSGLPPRSSEFVLVIQLTDVNDQPRALSLVTNLVQENSAVNSIVTSITFSDEDYHQSHTMRLKNSANGQFKLSSDGQKLLLAKLLDYETQVSYTITLEVTDNGTTPLSMAKNFTIAVTDINEAPISAILTDTGAQQTFVDNHAEVEENSKIGTVIATILATDKDVNETLKFTFDSNPNSQFAISPTVQCSLTQGSTCTVHLTVASALDYETSKRHYVVIRVTDQKGLWYIARFSIDVLDTNDPPTDIILSGHHQVTENVANVAVGYFTTTDPDPSQSYTYTLINTASGHLQIVGNELRLVRAVNYESTPVLTVVVQTVDSGSPALSFRKTFSISVLDVNEIPSSIHLSNQQIDENCPVGTIVADISTVDPDNLGKSVWQTFKYTLEQSAGDRFMLDGNTLKVKASNVKCLALGGVQCVLNYEATRFFTLTVRVRDSGTPPLSRDFNVNVTLKDINDRPRHLQLSNYKIHENLRIGTVIGTISGRDEDIHQYLSFTLIDNDGGRFTLVGNELRKGTVANFEIQTVHFVTIMMEDDGIPRLNITKRFAIEIVDVNEPPVSISITDRDAQLTYQQGLPQVKENSLDGTVFGTVVADDYDANESLSFFIDDSAGGLFRLGANTSCIKVQNRTGLHSSCQTQLIVNGSLNYEMTATHDIVIRVVDQKGLFKVRKFTVKVLDDNDIPHDIILLVDSIDENRNNELIGGLITFDQDLTHTHVYTLVQNPGQRFVIINSSLYTSSNASLNYEQQQAWTIVIRSEDNATVPLYMEKTFVITVIDVNEAPVSINLTSTKVKENSPIHTIIGEFVVVDPDNFGPKGRWQNATCILVVNADGIFIAENNIVKVAQASIDYERNKTFDLTAVCTDDGSPQKSATWNFTIDVENGNEAPVQTTISNNDIKENLPTGTLVAVLTTFDYDNVVSNVQTFNYSLVLPLKDLPFAVNGTSLVTTRPLNFEYRSSWPVVMKSTDSEGLSCIDSFQINVIDVNEAPTGFVVAGVASVPENSPAGTYAGDVIALDSDFNQSHTYRIVGVAQGTDSRQTAIDPSLDKAFYINVTSGKLFVGNVSLNYEALSSYTIWIVTTDHGLPPSLNYTGHVVINVSNINEAPISVTLDNNDVDEDSLVDTVVGHLNVSDPDNLGSNRQSQTFNCSVLDPTFHSFKVVAGTTLVVAKDNLDYELQPNQTIDIRCWDSDPLSPLFIDHQFTISILNINEAPTGVMPTNFTIGETEKEAGVITVRDPDNEVTQVQSFTLKLENGNSTSVPFILNGTVIEATSDLDFETQSSYVLNISVTDNGTPMMSTITSIYISVIDENEPPTGILLNSSGILETAPIGTVIGTLSTIDPDDGQSHTYRVLPFGNVSDSSMFGIVGNQLVLYRKLDYETEDDWPVFIQTTDGGAPPLTYQAVVNVVVRNVNEQPTLTLEDTEPITEDSPDGTFVANFTISDADINQTYTCWTATDQDDFIVVNSTISQEQDISVVVAPTAKLDFNTASSIQLAISCSDSGTPPLNATTYVSITIEDVNDAPTSILLSGDHKVPEHAPVGYGVGWLTVVDKDKGQSYTFGIHGPLASVFAVDDLTGQLVVRNTLDFENLTSPILSLVIEVADNGNPQLTYNETINITVIDINESPSDIRLSGDGTFFEGSPVGTVVGQLTCQNPEHNQSIVYSVKNVGLQHGAPEFDVYSNSTGSYLHVVAVGNVSVNWHFLQLEINATDNGIPPAWAMGTVIVTLELEDPCQNGCTGNEICQRQEPALTKECVCAKGYARDISGVCLLVDNCIVNPGLVVIVGSSDSTKSPQSQSICQNGATCISSIRGFQCFCPVTYTGQVCEIDLCSNVSSPWCHNGGKCFNFGSQLSCDCTATGYIGDRCDVEVDDCIANNVSCGQGTCIDGMNSYKCVCPPQATGRYCQYMNNSCQLADCLVDHRCIPLTSSQDHTCVKTDDILRDQFVNTTLTPDDIQKWKELVMISDFSDSDGAPVQPDDVYVLPSQSDNEVDYVVIYNGEAVASKVVDCAVHTYCQSVKEFDHGYDLCRHWTALRANITSKCYVEPGNPAPITVPLDPSPNYLVIGVVSGLSLLAAAIAISLAIYSRKRVKSIQQQVSRSQYSTMNVDDDDLAGNLMFDEDLADQYISSLGSSRFVRNPLYHNPSISDMYEEPGNGEQSTNVISPVYEGFSDTTINNPLYEGHADQSDDDTSVLVANTFYERTGQQTDGELDMEYDRLHTSRQNADELESSSYASIRNPDAQSGDYASIGDPVSEEAATDECPYAEIRPSAKYADTIEGDSEVKDLVMACIDELELDVDIDAEPTYSRLDFNQAARKPTAALGSAPKNPFSPASSGKQSGKQEAARRVLESMDWPDFN